MSSSRSLNLPWPDRRLERGFFERSADLVARELIGAVLVRRLADTVIEARIVETEAYLGAHDRAAHAFHGRTPRTEVLFGHGGHAYVYLIYGIHELLNVVAGGPGDPQAVLLRAAQALGDWKANLSGPGRLTRAMGITRADNGTDMTKGSMYFRRGSDSGGRIATGVRIGIDYAGQWREAPLRFVDADSRALSAPIEPHARSAPQR